MNQTRKPIARRVIIAVVIVVAALFAFAAWYVNDYYTADADAMAAVADANGAADGITVEHPSAKAIATRF